MLNKISVNAYAKINLYLDVVSKRSDGYHNIESVMQSVSLCDRVTVTLDTDAAGQKITQDFGESDLPCDETNLCYKAAKAYLDYFEIRDFDIHISVEKNIPHAAGLAGGSSDAAAVIKALDGLYDKNTDIEVLKDIGLKVGSDVPYCIEGGTCRVCGRGETVSKLSPLGGFYVVISKSEKESVSTKEAYSRIDLKKESDSKTSFEDYVCAVNEKDNDVIASGVYNIFQSVMSDTLSDTSKIIESMKKDGAVSALMSGSGPSVFGLFEKREDAESSALNLRKSYFAVVCTLV